MDLLKPLFELFACLSGTYLFEQGAPADYLYIILSGKVEVSFKPYDGIPITVSRVGKDSLCGWSAVVGSEKYTSSAIAIKNLKAYRVRGSELRKLCMDHPDAGKVILERLASAVSSRWKDAHKQVNSILAKAMQHH